MRINQGNRYDALRAAQQQGRSTQNQALEALRAAGAGLVQLFTAPRFGRGGPGRRYGPRFRR